MSPDGEVAPSVDVWVADAATGAEVNRDLTDGSGRFTLTVPPGRYTLSAVRPGFLQSDYGSVHHGLPGSPLVVTADRREEIRLVIHRAPVVAGVVRDDRGLPIANAAVAIVRPSIPRGAERQVVSRATTDANGVFRSDGLVPGRYLAVAMAPRPVDSGSGTVGLRTPAAQFFPRTDTESEAVLLELDPDQERTGVDFTLPRRPLASLTGVVISPENVKIQDDVLAIVTGREDSPPTWDAPLVVDGRRFVLFLHPGRYRIDIRGVGSRVDQPPQREGRLYFATAFVDVDDASSIIARQLHLREGLHVSGRVRGLDARTGDIGVRLVPTLPRQAAIRPVEIAPVGDGPFSVDAIAPGRYRVELIGANGSWALDFVRFRGQVQADPTIDIDASVGADDLELVIAPTTASLSGTLIGADDPPSSYVIGLLPQDGAARGPGASSLSLTRADNEGGYLFSKRRPGAYLLFLLRDSDVALLEGTTFVDDLRRNPAAGVKVSLTAGSESRLDLRIGSGISDLGPTSASGKPRR